MTETLIALGILGAALASVAIYHALSLESLLALGSFLIAAGFVAGLPTGFYYHVLLRRYASRRTALPGFWWVFPTRQHGHLLGEERQKVMLFFRAGAFGFFLILCGIGMFLAAFLK